MDSFENMNYKLAEFWTPVRQKNERMNLKVPKWDKPRSRSDSNSPFPDNYFDTQTRKFMKESRENLFQRGKQENVVCSTHPRTPLQILNTTVECAKSNIEKTAPKVCIGEHRAETESVLDGHLRGDRTPISSKSRCLPTASSSYVPKRTLINGPFGNKINIKKHFVIYDENCTTSLKENNEQSSSSINFTQALHLVDNFSDEKSQKTMVLSTCQDRKQKNLKSGLPTPRKAQPLGNKGSDRKIIFSPLKAVGLETLPDTEKIGSPFWGTDEGSIEDILSLHDVIRSANIWDIQENFNFHCCSNGCENFSESSPEIQLMQEPICQMDLEPPTIENFIPWNEI